MKKEYQKPIVELVNFSVSDIIMASPTGNFYDGNYMDFNNDWLL